MNTQTQLLHIENLKRQAALGGSKRLLRMRSAAEPPLSFPRLGRNEVQFLIPSSPGACSRGRFRPAQNCFGKGPAAYSA